ncbi:MAG TPA: serine hydrolase domain-containing protein [Caulobacteraceae bacterium]|jgi:CubicO group peptidase (beta-lactamase class C family)
MRRPDLDAWMERFTSPGRPGAAVGVRQGGAVIHEAGYGLANLEWDIPIGTDTVFRLGSITKQFTAAAVVKLAEAGKLGLGDPLERWLADCPAPWRGVTVRQLLDHSAGIANYTDDDRFMTEEVRRDHSLAQLIEQFRDLPPDFAPGERYQYSNSGYVLLGAVIEAASGQDYETCLRTQLFEPLGLARTAYLYDEPIVPRRASGYVGYRAPQNAPMISMYNPHAAGALGSTVGDLLRWEAALRGGEVVSAAGYRDMTTPGRFNDGAPMFYGLGLVRIAVRGETVIGHGGGINGFVTYLAHWPDHDLTVVVLANSGAFPVQQACFGLARRVLGQPDAAYEPVVLPDAALAARAGTYRFPTTEVLELQVKDGALAADFHHPGGVYRPFGDDRFFLADDPEITLVFEGDRVTLTDYRQPMVGERH